MEEKVLSSFNVDDIMQQSAWNFRRAWKGTVDVSVWLKVKMRQSGRIYLILQYKDKENTRALPIDRCLGGGTSSILLNGRVNMAGTGALENFTVKVKYEDCSEAIVVEELTLKFPDSNKSIRSMKLAV